MFSQIGMPGVVILLVVLLIAFGSKNLPTIGRSLGQALGEFKDAMMGEREQREEPTETLSSTPVHKPESDVEQQKEFGGEK